MDAELPKGVHKGPDGASRFWDGETWYEIDTPIASPPTSFFRTYRKYFLLALLLGLFAIGGTVFSSHQNAVAQQRVQHLAQEALQKAQAAQQKAQQKADDAERASRQSMVKEIEASVLKMAKRDAAAGTVLGPMKSVSCVAIAGGSTTDITQTTTKFQCFAVYKENSDGTSSGYYYDATMNWQTGNYTYGYGKEN